MNNEAEREFLELGRSGKSAWWRYLLGGAFIVIGYTIFGIFSYVIIVLVASALSGGISFGKLPVVDKKTGLLEGVDPIIGFIALNVSFLYSILFIWMVVGLLHRRPLLSLITPYKRLNWKRLGVGFATWFFLYGLVVIIEYLVFPQNYEIAFQFPQYFLFAPVVLFFTPLQCFAEELFFRGYLLQFLGTFNKNFWFLSVINGILFTLPHLANPEVPQDPVPTCLAYFAIGFLLAIITLRTNSLEIAIGAHAANNLFAALVVNYVHSPLQTRSIFIQTKLEPWFDLVCLIGLEIAFYLIVLKYIKSEKTG